MIDTGGFRGGTGLMEIRVQGSGGVLGWPEPNCRCASCLRAASQGASHAPSSVIIDGTLVLGAIPTPGLVPNALVTGALGADTLDGSAGTPGALPAEWLPGIEWAPGGYRIVRLARGWDVTGPDGGRLLYADGPGTSPDVPQGTARYDAVLLDLLGDPAQLGSLRARGLVTDATVPVALFADHRARSERELARRCRIWRAVLPADGDTLSVPAPAPLPGTGPPPYGPDRPVRVLVLGGARSGKSEEAEMRVAAEPAVTYVATGPVNPVSPVDPAPGEEPGDVEWAARIAAHRARRPSWWRTIESTDLAGVLGRARGAVLVDSVTTWLAAAMDECGAWDGGPAATAALAGRTGELVAAWRQAGAYVVAVSDETGLGIVPGTRSGRLFRDELGRLNQMLADESDEVIVVVAGHAQALPA
jgi:adenosylcobinamide kinase / adenosylcobinamide-phosphate guanylyltransferase